jgi:hypothetical protein
MASRLKRFAPLFSLCTGFSLLFTAMPPAHADVVHFYNGKVLRGKISRLTGDIIEFNASGLSTDNEAFERLTLTNRHDVVDIRGGKRLFGEIIYIDKFKVELSTASGLVKISRRKVKNIVLGTPKQQPMDNFMESMRQSTPQPAEPTPGMVPVNFSSPDLPVPRTTLQPVPGENEDSDAIPTDDRTP